MFITFEGVDGAGKSTQIALLEDFLDKKRVSYSICREPNLNIVCKSCLKSYLDKKNFFDSSFLGLFFLLARIQNWEENILPSIKEKEIVIVDRFIDSTLVYQKSSLFSFYRGTLMHQWFLRNFVFPDITFIFDIDSLSAQERILSRGQENELLNLSLKEIQEIVFRYKKLRKYPYLRPSRYCYIDANKTKDEIFQDIISYIKFA